MNKNSISLTGGVRGAHHTISSSDKRTTSVGIPGSGLSYTTTSCGKKSRKKKSDSDSGSGFSAFLKVLGFIASIVILFMIGCFSRTLF